MTRRYSIEWLLLVPYFAVASLNVPAGVGGDRRSTNRTNAQLILALIVVSPFLFAMAALGVLGNGIIRQHPYLLGLALLLPAWLSVSQWLKGKREAEYRRAYAAMGPAARTVFGLVTATLVVAGWVVFMVPR